MNKFSYLLTSLFLCIAVSSCSEKDDVFTPRTFDVQGKVEKGPFISGSTISIQPMDAKLQILGSTFNTTISDDLGNFLFGSKEFSRPYAELMANGYFFNEVKGQLSRGTLSLRALVDLRDYTTINVNILTHLKYARIKNLVSSGNSFEKSNTQAQKELMDAFGLSAYNNIEVSSFSIISGTDESAALIAISSLLLMDRSEAAFTEYLSKLSECFGRNGKFTDEIIAQIEKDKQRIAKKLSNVKDNIISRYDELGIPVTVKDLQCYIDWDNDGKAGNEVLKTGDSVILDKTSIEVPNEGGTFSIQINSPISLYLEPQVKGVTGEDNLDVTPDYSLNEEAFFVSFYEGYNESDFSDNGISCESVIENNVLVLKVSPLRSKANQNTNIQLYDYVGNVVASVDLTQEGNMYKIPVSEIPLLGESTKLVVSSIASSLASGLKNYNVMEQYYVSNKENGKVLNYINPNSNLIYNTWSKFYNVNANLLFFRKEDKNRLDVYEDYCNVLSALYYSNLIYGWGDIPHINDYSTIELRDFYVSRESTQKVFKELKSNLVQAVENLEEKKNESMKDANGFFFMSKDVARVLLANIYMYEGNYNDARPLLQKVIDNGFYKLDASMNFKPSSTTNDIDVKESTEVILAFLNNDAETRASVTIMEAEVIPYITLSDVHLSLAECFYKLGDNNEAEKQIKEVTDAKNINLSETNVLMKIKEVRERILLYSGTYFAFLKRTDLAKEVCDIEDYQLLFPIPSSEVDLNPNIKQNPGY